MANVKWAMPFFCHHGCPEFPSPDSTSSSSGSTQPRTIHPSDICDLVRKICVLKPEFNMQKSQILQDACRLVGTRAHCYSREGQIPTEELIGPSVKELYRILQQVEGLLESYSAEEAPSPLLLLKADNTEAFVHLIYDLRCAFASFDALPGEYTCIQRDLESPVWNRKHIGRLSEIDRRRIVINLSQRPQADAMQTEASGIGPLNRLVQMCLGPCFQNFSHFNGFVLTLDLQDLTIQRKIAETRYAQVYEGIWRGQIRVAVKTYTGCCHDLCQQEASVHAKLQHPNVVQFIGLMKDNDGNASSVVTELMSFCTLQDEIDGRREEGRPFTSLEAINIIIQIARGMSYLRSQGVMHRDLKPSNILICSCKNCKCVGNMGSLHVKIADFGDAKTASSRIGTPNVGTFRWMAPEVHSFNKHEPAMKAYTYQADVYSFGILCYEIVTGEVPFKGLATEEYYKRIGSGERPELPSECPEGLARLIGSCWAGEASKRPDFEDICEDLRCLREVQIFGRVVNGPYSGRDDLMQALNIIKKYPLQALNIIKKYLLPARIKNLQLLF